MTVFHTLRYALKTDMSEEEFTDIARRGLCLWCNDLGPSSIPEYLNHLADHAEGGIDMGILRDLKEPS